MAQKLEGFEQARRQWVADTSHELRTPITILRAHTEAMRDGIMPLSQQGLGRISSAVNDLERLVTDLYQLARADIGLQDYAWENVPLADVLENLQQQFSAPLQQAGLSLTINANQPFVIRADAGRLQHLFSNLLSNSLRYTTAGGSIVITAAPEKDGVQIVIDDSAPNVPDSALPHLFERFYRVDASHSRSSGGSGLGLSIGQAIVAGHGGTIIPEHSPLGGLRIRLNLPLAKV